MPAIKVYAKKMESTVKENIAKQFLDTIQEQLKVPIAEIFFLDLEKVYGPEDREYGLLEIEGPVKDAETIERLGKSLCTIFTDASGGNCYVSAIYHHNYPSNVIDANGALNK